MATDIRGVAASRRQYSLIHDLYGVEMALCGGGMGAGRRMVFAAASLRSPTVFAYILTMLVVGLLLDAMMLRIQQAFPAWHGNA